MSFTFQPGPYRIAWHRLRGSDIDAHHSDTTMSREDAERIVRELNSAHKNDFIHHWIERVPRALNEEKPF